MLRLMPFPLIQRSLIFGNLSLYFDEFGLSNIKPVSQRLSSKYNMEMEPHLRNYQINHKFQEKDNSGYYC